MAEAPIDTDEQLPLLQSLPTLVALQQFWDLPVGGFGRAAEDPAGVVFDLGFRIPYSRLSTSRTYSQPRFEGLIWREG